MRYQKFSWLFMCLWGLWFWVFTSSSGTLRAAERYEVACDSLLWCASLDTAIAQEGTREVGANRGPVTKYWSWQFSYPVAYCYLGQYWSFLQVCPALGLPTQAIPMLRTGLASAGFNDAKRRGTKTTLAPQRGDLVFWRLPRSVSGHVERIKSALPGGVILTVGFNTSSGQTGSQRDGGGVWPRKRTWLHPLGRMLVAGFVGRKSDA